MSPALVMAYRRGNETDRNDADAILEAVTRPSMRFAMVKSVAQEDLLSRCTGCKGPVGQEPHRPVQSAAGGLLRRARRGGADRSGGA